MPGAGLHRLLGMLEETGIPGGVPRRQPDVVLTGEQQHRLPELGDGLPGGDRVQRAVGVAERHRGVVALAVLLGLVRLRSRIPPPVGERGNGGPAGIRRTTRPDPFEGGEGVGEPRSARLRSATSRRS